MDQPGNNSAEHALPSGRLNGWKEISVYLGKSVRTVQRWEKELHLPVHRIHTSRGEIIWASPNEIDSWLTRTETARAAEVELHGVEEHLVADKSASAPAVLTALGGEESIPYAGSLARWRWWQMALASVGMLVAGAALWAVIQSGFWRTKRTLVQAGGQPMSFRVEGDRLKIYGADKRLLWEHAFPWPLAENYYDGSDPETVSHHVQFGDFDGDGRNEIAFIARSNTTTEHELFVFNPDGSVRFRRRPGRPVRFGGGDNSPPFYASIVLLSTGPRGEKNLWLVGQHNTWFPTVVEKLSTKGEVLGEFWSNGHVNRLAEATWNNRKVILVGAMYNDEKRASLAVLDYENPGGAAPAVDPHYRCDDCPAGQPLRFYVFPRSEVARILDVRPSITTLRVTPHGETLLAIESAGLPLPGDSKMSTGSVFYTLDSQFQLKEAEPGDNYRQLHGKLELLGKLKHAYGARDDAEMFPVLQWDGKQFVSLPGPQKPALSDAKPAAIARE